MIYFDDTELANELMVLNIFNETLKLRNTLDHIAGRC